MSLKFHLAVIKRVVNGEGKATRDRALQSVTDGNTKTTVGRIKVILW